MKNGAWAHGRRIIGALLAAAALLAAPVQAQEGPSVDGGYESGRGLRLGDSGFTLGGYATLEYRHEAGQPEQLKSGHASAFVWWEGLDRVKVFAEFDLRNAVSQNRHANDDGSRRVTLERLYVDLALLDNVSLRGGKFLTPIGRWNQIHAEPLVWTTTSPLLTQVFFPRNVTGGALSGQWHGGDRSLSWVAFVSNGSEWRADRWQDPFSRARGLRATLPLAGEVQLGVSLANYELDSLRGESRRLRGLDLYWARQGWEVSAEWLRTNPLPNRIAPPGPGNGAGNSRSWPLDAGHGGLGVLDGAPYKPPPPGVTGGSRRNQGGFVQGVAPLGAGWFVVLRAEQMTLATISGRLQRSVVGLTWRPTPASALKFEWAQDDGNPQRQGRNLASSFSVLF